MKNPITLVVIDPQVDFVSGSLAVSSAHEAMSYLAQWGLEHIEEIESVVFTSDQHPFDHCSFTSQGGVWPSHCVRYTEGAAITPELLPLVHEVYRRHIPFCMVEKATTPERDSYSAFPESVPPCYRKGTRDCPCRYRRELLCFTEFARSHSSRLYFTYYTSLRWYRAY